MNKICLTAAAFCALSSTFAFAADLPSRLPPPVYAAPPPIFTWTGVYIGATAGYAFDTDHKYSNTDAIPSPFGAVGFGVVPGFVRNRNSGFTGGGEIGYNYQIPNSAFFGNGGVVTGIEADAMYVGPGSDSRFFGPFGLDGATFHARTEFVGTVRGRLGYAFDNFLVYGTGGFAYGGVNDSIGVTGFVGTTLLAANRSTINTGYAYGGGVAYAIPTSSPLNFFHASGVILKAEYLHYDLGSNSIVVAGTFFPVNSNIKASGNLVRAGIDYKFDFFAPPPAPIVAKY